MIHGLVWHYLYEVGHFHYMMDEHILEYSGLEAFFISVYSSSHTRAYPLLREHRTFHRFHSPFRSSCWPLRVVILGHTLHPWDHRTFHRLHSFFYLVVDSHESHIGAYPHSLGSSYLSQALVSFDLVTRAYPLRLSLLASLSELSFGFGPLDQVVHHLVLSIRVWGRTYIDQPSHCLVSLVFGTALISISHSLC